MPAFALENAKKFCFDLLDYLGSHAQYLYSMLMNSTSTPVVANPTTTSTAEKKRNPKAQAEEYRSGLGSS